MGSFTFLPASHEATFERNVRIRRRNPQGQNDFIAADDSVKIVFDVKKPAKPPGAHEAAKAPAANSPPGTFDPNLTFKELHAHGKDVSLVSEANGLKALKLHDVDYDRAARVAKLSAMPNQVQIWHHEDRLHAPYIQINHDESGQEVTEIWCRGEGGMRHIDEKTHEPDLAAEWKKEMHKYADPKTGLDVVDLEEAMIEQPKEHSGILADHISLYLIRQIAAQHSARPNTPASAGKRTQAGPQLHHLIAVQRNELVAMVSKQIETESKRLEIWFQDAPSAASNSDDGRPRLRAVLQPTSLWLADSESATNAGPPSGSTLSSNAAEGIESPGAQPARATRGAVGTAPAAKPLTKVQQPATATGALLPTTGESTEPYVMKADEIYVRVNRGAANAPAQVSNVVSKGSVHLTQAQKDGAEPLLIEGDQLDIDNRGPTDQEMVVHGQPGHVKNRGAHIEGSRIVFDRGKNTADVDGAGTLHLPVKQSTEAGKPEKTAPFDVSWLNNMHFDGKTALFIGSVHSKLDDGEEQSDIRCKEMGVTLTKPFSFSKERKDQDQPEIDTIDCYGGVNFESKTIVDGNLTEKRRGQVTQLHFHKQNGQSEAQGPGVLHVWRFNENGQSGMAQFANVQANSPPKTQKHAHWEYMQVKFDGRMDGDFRQMMSPPPGQKKPSQPREPSVTLVSGRQSRGRRGGAANSILGANGAWTTIFHDHVEVLYGPVEQPTEIVSREYLQDQAGWLGCDTLRVDQHPLTVSKDQYITLLATGNSRIEGKDFFGEAESISYDGSKTLYVLRGDANRQARLWRQLQVGGDSSYNGSNQIFFDPVHHTVKQDAMQNMDIVQ